MTRLHVNKKEFQRYLDVCYNTALKQYDLFLSLCNKSKGHTLTTIDISRIDDVPIDVVEKRIWG